jgi:hypothetical protein
MKWGLLKQSKNLDNLKGINAFMNEENRGVILYALVSQTKKTNDQNPEEDK